MTILSQIIEKMEKFAPTSIAEDWDPIGLSFGTKNKKIKKVLVALDLDPNTLEEAILNQADLVLTHHPLIFKPVATLNGEDAKRRMFIRLIQEEIAVYSAHTNLDVVSGGMNDWLAEALELADTEVLVPSQHPEYPDSGLGRVGSLAAPKTLNELLKHIDSSLSPSGIRYNIPEQAPDTFQRIAVLGGAGASYYRDALEAKADIYITGDISYHDAQDMLRDGLSFIDPGHFAEKIYTQKMTAILSEWKQKNNWDIEIIPTEKQTDVFKFHKI